VNTSPDYAGCDSTLGNGGELQITFHGSEPLLPRARFYRPALPLLRFNPQTRAFAGEDGSFPNTYGVRALLADRDGALWLVTYNGLVRFDPQTETFTQYRSNPAKGAGVGHLPHRAGDAA